MSHRGQLQCLNNAAVSYHSHTMTASSSYSPVTKMPQPQRTASTDSQEGVRKRVCKACDRCRLKKSKCDGSHPCSRCKADNAICVFGERKKSHDKVYPKGYVEMLEQQQSQLVSGLQEMYRRLLAANAWTGSTLSETNGHPLTHDILAALDLLEMKHDGSGDVEPFEEDCSRLQSRLIAEGAGFTQRRGSFSSDSEHSQQGHARSGSQNTPTFSKPPGFKENFNFSAPPSPRTTQSPVPGTQQRQSFPPPHSSPLSNDPQFYQAEWAYPEPQNADLLMRSKAYLHSSTLENGLPSFGQWDTASTPFDVKYDINMTSFTSYPQQHIPTTMDGLSRVQESTAGGMSLDQMMDVEFNQFIQVSS